MTVKTEPSVLELKTWFLAHHVTITFHTKSGSAYTLVVRNGKVVLVKDTTGEVFVGTEATITPGGCLIVSEGTGPRDRWWQTTTITRFYVLSN